MYSVIFLTTVRGKSSQRYCVHQDVTKYPVRHDLFLGHLSQSSWTITPTHTKSAAENANDAGSIVERYLPKMDLMTIVEQQDGNELSATCSDRVIQGNILTNQNVSSHLSFARRVKPPSHHTKTTRCTFFQAVYRMTQKFAKPKHCHIFTGIFRFKPVKTGMKSTALYVASSIIPVSSRCEFGKFYK